MLPELETAAITWLGHASVLVGVRGQRLLFDPVIRTRVGHIRRLGRDRVRPHDIERIDAVFVSHAHQDHLDVGSLRRIQRLNPDAIFVAPRGAAEVLRHAHIEHVREVSIGETVALRSDRSDDGVVHVEVAFAAHDGGRHGVGRRLDGVAVSYVVRAADTPSVWFAGDTELDPKLRSIGPIDVALVPVGGWWRTLGPGHMNGVQAARAVDLVQARVAIPIHWGTYHPMLLYRAMAGMWREPADTLRDAAALSESAVDVRVLDVGGGTHVTEGDVSRA